MLTLKFYFSFLFYLAWERRSHEVPKTEAEANNRHQEDQSESSRLVQNQTDISLETSAVRLGPLQPSCLTVQGLFLGFTADLNGKKSCSSVQQARLQMKWNKKHVNQAKHAVVRHPSPKLRLGFLPAFHIAYWAVIWDSSGVPLHHTAKHTGVE